MTSREQFRETPSGDANGQRTPVPAALIFAGNPALDLPLAPRIQEDSP
jgi:hypothetical protein